MTPATEVFDLNKSDFGLIDHDWEFTVVVAGVDINGDAKKHALLAAASHGVADAI